MIIQLYEKSWLVWTKSSLKQVCSFDHELTFFLYKFSVSDNKESATSPETDLNQRNPAHTISAALTYTTQMLSILSYFLSINLPRKLCYRYVHCFWWSLTVNAIIRMHVCLTLISRENYWCIFKVSTYCHYIEKNCVYFLSDCEAGPRLSVRPS